MSVKHAPTVPPAPAPPVPAPPVAFEPPVGAAPPVVGLPATEPPVPSEPPVGRALPVAALPPVGQVPPEFAVPPAAFVDDPPVSVPDALAVLLNPFTPPVFAAEPPTSEFGDADVEPVPLHAAETERVRATKPSDLA